MAEVLHPRGYLWLKCCMLVVTVAEVLHARGY